MDQGDLQYTAFKVYRHRLSVWRARKKLKARRSQNSTGGLWELGYMALPKFRETLTKAHTGPRSNVKILIKEVNPL
jgi:hypothetical protein